MYRYHKLLVHQLLVTSGRKKPALEILSGMLYNNNTLGTYSFIIDGKCVGNIISRREDPSRSHLISFLNRNPLICPKDHDKGRRGRNNNDWMPKIGSKTMFYCLWFTMLSHSHYVANNPNTNINIKYVLTWWMYEMSWWLQTQVYNAGRYKNCEQTHLQASLVQENSISIIVK